MKNIIYVTLLFFVLFSFNLSAQETLSTEDAAIALLQKLDLSKATDADLFEMSAACRRLARIGTEKSVDVLEKLLDDQRTRDYARTALKSIVGEQAEAALKRHPSKKDNASPIDEKKRRLLSTALPTILKGDDAGLAEFVRLLKSEDRTEFNVALEAFRKFPDRKIVDLLAKEQANLKPDHRIAAILSLQDRTDVVPVPQEIVEAAKTDSNPEVQVAAMAVLGVFPDDDKIQFLFLASKGTNEKSAVEILAMTKYPKIDQVIVDKVSDSDPNIRLIANQLAGERSVKAAESKLWMSTKDEQWGSVQFTAFLALGRIVDQTGFEKLLNDYSSNDFENIKHYILSSIKTACQLSADRSAYAKLIGEKISNPATQLDLLDELGGDEALKSIVEIAKATDKDEIRDQATKILGEWTGAEVASVLLELSASLKEEKYKVRTLRGFLRAVRQFDMPKEEKRKLCEKALEIACRDEEKKLVREQLDRLK